MTKKTFPLSEVYRLLEPGPVVLVTTAQQRQGEYHDHVVADDDGVRASVGGVCD